MSPRSLSRRVVLWAFALFVGAPLVAGASDPLSYKRGFADVSSSDSKLQVTNSAWYYTWGPSKPAGVADYDAEFLPMIWWGGQANQTNIDRILGYGDVEWVLGFNEPERPDQANMTVDQAISAWRVLDAGFDGTDVKLVSPAPSDTQDGQAWLSSFMNRANAEGLQVDGVAFHWYGASSPNNPIGSAQNFLNRVDAYHNQYGLPVFITEFAMHDWQGDDSVEAMREANRQFLEYVIPRLESRSYVERYSFYNWFADARLFEGNPATPTDIGIEYAGAVEAGQTYDLSGKQLGDRVMYLAGGELDYSAGGRGNVNHLHALKGTSTIAGEVDWGLDAGDWARVEPRATVQKVGDNRLAFDAIRLTNDGLIQVVDGELALLGNTRITGSGSIRVDSQGGLTIGGVVPGGVASISHPIELRGGALGAAAGSEGGVGLSRSLVGEGTVTSNLHAQLGSAVEVDSVSAAATTLRVIGDYAADAGSELLLDLVSPESYDRLVVNGAFTPGGTLDVRLAAGAAQPASGDEYDLLDFTEADGEFDALVLPTLQGDLAWDLSGLYTEGALRVTATPGDYNGDGKVDAADYTVWRDHVGESAGALPNDIDGGAIGAAQFETWRANFGLTAAGPTAVPEPAAALLLIIGVASFTRPRGQ